MQKFTAQCRVIACSHDQILIRARVAQDAVIREHLGRLSTLGVTLLDLPPEVAAAYAVPDVVAGGAAVYGGASTSAGAFAGGLGGNSELQRLLHDSAEIDMSAALAIIHREHAGLQPAAIGGVAGTALDGEPPPVSMQAASTQAEFRPPSLARWSTERADRLGAPRANQLPVTDEALGKTFSFPRPRNSAGSPPIAPSLSPRRQSSADPTGGTSRSIVLPHETLRSEDSEAATAAKALMADLSGSEDEADAPKSAGGWLSRGRGRKTEPGQYEAEMQRRQAGHEREKAEDQRNAAAIAAGAIAAAAAADAERRREQQRLAKETAQHERVRAEAAAREDLERRADAQRAREAAAAAEDREARAAAQLKADRAAAKEAAAAAEAAKSAHAAAATFAAAEQAGRQAHGAEDRSFAAKEAESDQAQAAAMTRAAEHAADAAEMQVSQKH